MMSATYLSLESDFTSQLANVPSFTVGQAASLFTSFSFLFTLGIMVVIVTGAGALGYAGLQRIQPSEQAVSKSNKIAKRAVLGTLGVLSLYVILRTFNADLVTGNVGLDKLRGERGQNIPSTPTAPASPTTPSNASETQNRQALAAAGIQINKEPCGTRTSDCTNVANLQPAVMAMLIQLKDSCPGSTIVVTGGTEPGHSTNSAHYRGRAVDLRIGNQALDSCILRFNNGPNLRFCNRTRTGMGGFVFCDEKNAQGHWHIYY